MWAAPLLGFEQLLTMYVAPLTAFQLKVFGVLLPVQHVGAVKFGVLHESGVHLTCSVVSLAGMAKLFTAAPPEVRL